MRYSLFNIIANGLSGQRYAEPAWRDAPPKPSYDAIIVGGGGHGLATAYYLAKEHGMHDIAVLEKGWIGSGNSGRNTTIIRSNYLLPGNEPFYEWGMKLWEGMEQDLNYNVMVSQRGIINLIHNDAQRDVYARRGNAMILAGAGARLLSREEVRGYLPFLDFDNARFPVRGGLMQPRAGTARHDAVVWGYARGASRLGADIVQNCEVNGFIVENGRVVGVKTTRGEIRAKKVALAVAGSTSKLTDKLGIKLPIESFVLQAFISEGLKPFVETVFTFGAGHFYCSQSDKGELVFGGDLDGYNSYAQRGNLPTIEDVIEGGVALVPALSRVRLLRQWAGLCDMCMDGSPIICAGPLPGLYLNCAWSYGGFKATPASGWCFAHTIAKDAPHPLSAAFRLDRFRRGYVIDEKGVGAQPNLH